MALITLIDREIARDATDLKIMQMKTNIMTKTTRTEHVETITPLDNGTFEFSVSVEEDAVMKPEYIIGMLEGAVLIEACYAAAEEAHLAEQFPEGMITATFH